MSQDSVKKLMETISKLTNLENLIFSLKNPTAEGMESVESGGTKSKYNQFWPSTDAEIREIDAWGRNKNQQ